MDWMRYEEGFRIQYKKYIQTPTYKEEGFQVIFKFTYLM